MVFNKYQLNYDAKKREDLFLSHEINLMLLIPLIMKKPLLDRFGVKSKIQFN